VIAKMTRLGVYKERAPPDTQTDCSKVLPRSECTRDKGFSVGERVAIYATRRWSTETRW
jgi:hypothetical protein